MKSLQCPLKYIGQKGEHSVPDTKNTKYVLSEKNNSNSGYSNHILNTLHTFGPVTDNVDIVKKGKKGKHLNN
jgi:hypothetical protein